MVKLIDAAGFTGAIFANAALAAGGLAGAALAGAVAISRVIPDASAVAIASFATVRIRGWFTMIPP
jgi:hypothetical protein